MVVYTANRKPPLLPSPPLPPSPPLVQPRVPRNPQNLLTPVKSTHAVYEEDRERATPTFHHVRTLYLDSNNLARILQLDFKDLACSYYCESSESVHVSIDAIAAYRKGGR